MRRERLAHKISRVGLRAGAGRCEGEVRASSRRSAGWLPSYDSKRSANREECNQYTMTINLQSIYCYSCDSKRSANRGECNQYTMTINLQSIYCYSCDSKRSTHHEGCVCRTRLRGAEKASAFSSSAPRLPVTAAGSPRRAGLGCRLLGFRLPPLARPVAQAE